MASTRRSLLEFENRKEGEELEFKDPRVLEDPYAIAREVCAFLNTREGGELVIGISDAGEPVPIPKLEGEVGRLTNRLASLIAPSLPARVRVDSLEGNGILVTVGRRENDDLFAVRSTKGRVGVFRRVANRIVALDWAEIRDFLRGSDPSATERGDSAEKVLLDWRTHLESSAARRVDGLLIVLTHEPRIESDVARAQPDRIKRAIEDPSTIGLRREGMHYSVGTCERKRRMWIGGSKEAMYRALEVDPRGVLRFGTGLGNLLGDRVSGCPRTETIYPLSLIETIVSCLALFGALIESTQAGGTVACAIDLIGVKDHSLPPYRHGTLGFLSEAHWKDAFREERLAEIVKETSKAKAFAENPHRMAHDLVRSVYEEFGYGSHELGEDGERIPYWDPDRAMFVLPA